MFLGADAFSLGAGRAVQISNCVLQGKLTPRAEEHAFVSVTMCLFMN